MRCHCYRAGSSWLASKYASPQILRCAKVLALLFTLNYLKEPLSSIYKLIPMYLLVNVGIVIGTI